MYIGLYADDILLISPSVCMLEKLLRMCEHELGLLDMAIRPNTSTSTGADIPWVDEIRYFGIFIVRSHKFKCSLDYAKKNHTIEQPMQFLVRLGDMHPKM